ncbi:hypothetical protein [Micromonospora sp. NPDC049679]|uniref:hypothetical protein n=1 Tax=Micromonospora sp. NPDC049679 TaxID=3155920 RepID=UPI0033D14420
MVVTVYSDPRSTKAEPTGVEYYRTDDFKDKVPRGHQLRKNTEDAFDAVDDSERDTERHITKAQDTGVREDPVASWGIAGGIGLAVAFGGWALLGGGAAGAVVQTQTQADFALAR